MLVYPVRYFDVRTAAIGTLNRATGNEATVNLLQRTETIPLNRPSSRKTPENLAPGANNALRFVWHFYGQRRIKPPNKLKNYQILSPRQRYLPEQDDAVYEEWKGKVPQLSGEIILTAAGNLEGASD